MKEPTNSDFKNQYPPRSCSWPDMYVIIIIACLAKSANEYI